MNQRNNSKLYVGNLDYGVRKDDLVKLFSQVGNVIDAVVIMDRDTNRSRGFGFVEFETEQAAEEAIEKFHETEFEGRNLIVNKAKPKRD